MYQKRINVNDIAQSNVSISVFAFVAVVTLVTITIVFVIIIIVTVIYQHCCCFSHSCPCQRCSKTLSSNFVKIKVGKCFNTAAEQRSRLCFISIFPFCSLRFSVIVFITSSQEANMKICYTISCRSPHQDSRTQEITTSTGIIESL